MPDAALGDVEVVGLDVPVRNPRLERPRVVFEGAAFGGLGFEVRNTRVQGYLAHKKPTPPRTLQQDCA